MTNDFEEVCSALPHPVNPGEIAARLERVIARLADSDSSLGDWDEIEICVNDLEVLTASANVSASPDSGEPGAEIRAKLVPSFEVDFRDDDSVRGRCSFAPFYMGNGEESRRLGSVHGGAIALLFDDMLGWISLRGGTVRTRTAYLKVNFRSMAKVSTEMTFFGWTDTVEGRKQLIRGELKDGDVLVADAEALFVTPKEWNT